MFGTGECDINRTFKEFEKLLVDYKNKGLLPQYFKAPIGIQWEITHGCNLRCLHCYNNSYDVYPNELTEFEALNLIEEMENLRVFYLILTGGEPLLRKDFLMIAERAFSAGIHASLITNGFFMKRKFAEKIREFDFDWVQVSIDGAVPETHDKIRGVKGS